MLIAAFALFFLMLVSWMVAPGDKVRKPELEMTPASEPTMVPAL